MKRIKIVLIDKSGKRLNLNALGCNRFEKGIGLMFSRKKTAKILAFRFKKSSHLSIHSFFVFFPFIAIWIDDKNKILCWKKVKPFTFYVSPPKLGYFSLIEIPMTVKYSKYLKFFK